VPFGGTFFLLFTIINLQAQGIYIDFGQKDITRYVQNVGNTAGSDGEIALSYIKPEYCAKNIETAIYFAIDDAHLFQRPEGTFSIINVEYFDAPEREIKLIYDSRSHSDKEHGMAIKTTGSNGWKSVCYFLEDAYFGNRQKYNADFRLECADTMYINVVRVVPIDYYIDYGDPNYEHYITQKELQGGDSKTEIITQNGEECITSTLADQYLYCDVDDAELLEDNPPEFFISVEYYDSSPQLTMRLQYDSIENPYQDTPWIQGKGWGSFKTYTWEISDGLLSGRQNGTSDFRLHLQQPGLLINRIALGYLDYGPTRVENAPARLANFRLDQNYPNPFNPVTSILYQVPHQSHISLKIYNLKGELIRTLAEADHAAGIYHLTWDGLDDAGAMSASGQYIYRYVADGFVKSNKMIKLN
jgi:hypothetical protein